jgi:hypothetical protein
MPCDLAAICREFAALADDLGELKAAAFAELGADVARHGETRLATTGWWPVDRRRKPDKLKLIEARLEGLRDVVSRMAADGVYPSKKQKDDGRRRLRDVVRANPAR